MAVISLTSVPPRFERLHETLETLLAQRGCACEIWLHIPRRYRRFPDWTGWLPDLDPRIRILRSDDDFGPATKVLPALSELRGTDDTFLFCDDDRLYDRDWAARLLSEQADRPGMCVAAMGQHAAGIVPGAADPTIRHRAQIGAHRDLRYTLHRTAQRLRERRFRPRAPKPAKPGIRKAGMTEILKGYGGAAIRPGFFDDAVFDVFPPMMFVDDIWLSGHLARRAVPVWLPEDVNLARPATAETAHALHMQSFDGMPRDALNSQAIRYFQSRHGIWCGSQEPLHRRPASGLGPSRTLCRRIRTGR